ncbi:MAG: gamma-glutamyl-gamma-aminobutyrate hydrolase family protein [Actinobacteria bacterium]|nr:gamma-glutamyl-gamma-aminobutyrate hydrolase family protein [Actinomycetota bacterium]
MKTIAILSHSTVAHELVLIQEWADARGHGINRYFREEEWNANDLLEADLIITMGSPNSVATGYTHQSAAREIELLQQRLAREEAVFGICYGAQALALALGGAVIRRAQANTGYKNITLHDPAIDAGGWALWHEDMINPDSLKDHTQVEILATDAGAVIAFRAGNAWGVQFHPEVDGDGLGRMLSAIGIPEEKWEGEVAAMNADNDAHRERAFALFDLVVASTDH